jgi:hypothetical protein
LIAERGRWYKTTARDEIHKVLGGPKTACPGGSGRRRGRLARLEFANLPHDFAETLELVFVGITIVVSLAIMVAFGRWWQR